MPTCPTCPRCNGKRLAGPASEGGEVEHRCGHTVTETILGDEHTVYVYCHECEVCDLWEVPLIEPPETSAEVAA